MHTICVLILALAVGFSTPAGQIPHDRDALLSGEESGVDDYAEAHGYPSARAVLDAAVEISLSSVQKRSIEKIYDQTVKRGREIGKQVVRIEEEMNRAFKNGLMTEKSITADTRDIGRLRGKLRALQLAAHLQVRKVLTSEQVRIFVKMHETRKRR